MRVLVCGGRDFLDQRAVYDALDRLHERRGIDLVIEGGALGADRLARSWAGARGVPGKSYLAQWGAHGKGAGPRRNQRMLDDGKPDVVIAFPGGTGTADMVARARKAGLVVWELCK
jgi:hypothetical protein